jgi:hypothetical protein
MSKVALDTLYSGLVAAAFAAGFRPIFGEGRSENAKPDKKAIRFYKKFQ